MSEQFSINERLVRGLTAEEKKEFMDAFKANRWLLIRIRTILEQDIETLVKESESDKPFELPNYSEFQLSNIAERKALRKLIKLLPKGE